MKIIVVGAGIGGLVTALRLHHAGLDCEIYEQSEQIRELGVGINVLPYAVRELAAVGLLDRLAQTGVRTGELTYAHRLGQEIMVRPCGTDAGFDVPQFSIHRGRLQGLLLRAVLERLGADAVRTGHRLTGFDQDADAVTARFADPGGAALPPVRADVLVGADGIHSTVRAQLFPHEGPPHWNGVTMWRGATEWPVFGTGASMIIAGGTQAKLVIYPIAPGATADTRLTNWVLCVKTGADGDPAPSRQDWSRRAEPADVRPYVDRFRLEALDHTALVAATPEFFVFPMCDREPLPFWTQGRVTLLGDAAHPMYPMGSSGAGQATLDATSLAAQLAGAASATEALLAYQGERLPASTDLVRRNRAGGPEGVIDIVEQRAPDGFTDLAAVIDPTELHAIVTSYTKAAAGSPAR
ncbi:MAG TPA: flavin-dependent oxidoreductase [Actinophytocola sp.]|uniref:flavin-dependent oxidoreductase n=1 Tax=Actinophytocola sp. TaxID=1872138 RepID=UPI002DBF2816|nr:flavin-dependent oxidoreductase [Actinophytocola sp.]HEU5472531.1 flavin-dependent oxidoreductase [Actinophytocola sp.]